MRLPRQRQAERKRREIINSKPNADNQTLEESYVHQENSADPCCDFIDRFVIRACAGANRRRCRTQKTHLEQIANGVRTQPSQIIETEVPPADLLTAQQGGILDILERQKNALAGAWDLTLTFSDGSQVKSTLNVAPGRADGEGSVIHSAEASLTLPNPTTAEQGAWRHIGGLQFIASYRGFAVDEKFTAPAGTIGFRHAITLNSDQESFTGRAILEVKDTSGKVLFSDTIQTRGARLKAVAP